MTAVTPAFIANFQRFRDLSDLIRHDLPEFKYSYMDIDEFVNLVAKDVSAATRVYVQELLFRAHWAALATIFRNRRWMDGVDAAIQQPNYFAFSACLRGLLESAGDSHEAMYASMATVAEHFYSFGYALSAKFSEAVFSCQPLEDILIHFSHARRVGKSEVVPESHRAKTMQDYLTSFEEEGERGLRNLYAELCEITHPAAVSTQVFSEGDPKHPQVVRFTDPNDLRFIADLLKRHDKTFVILFQKSFNAALLTLTVLNRFNDPRFYTPGAAHVNFERVPAFSEIDEKISASQKKFHESMKEKKQRRRIT